MKKLLVLLFSLGLTACMTLSPDPKLLTQTQNTSSIVEQGYQLETDINPKIEKQLTGGGIKQLVHKTLEVGLSQANIFASKKPEQYKIKAYIEKASQQAGMSLGRFRGVMIIHYTVTDPNGKTILDKEIETVKGSDKWSIFGAERHMRSRIVNSAENVNQFIAELDKTLKASKAKKSK
ncbi:hypothetical protein BMT54_04195 [Pasteurellaceae bacterium 15-036681]|nr:hypothetical protein BMT54_04195 [Pasteurellaceae bacterium 15-036681]